MRKLLRIFVTLGAVGFTGMGPNAQSAEAEKTVEWFNYLPQGPCLLCCNTAPDCDCAST